MSELDDLLAIVKKMKEQPSATRRYPKEFWTQTIKLSEEIGAQNVAKKLGLSYGNLARRIRLASDRPDPPKKASKKTSDFSFIEIPVTKSKKQIILDLPHNISLRIDL